LIVGLLRQYALLLHLSLSIVRQRLAAALTVVVAMACVVGVLVSMLSATTGIVRAFRISSDPDMALVLPNNSLYDDGSGVARNVIGTILDAPGIARGADGKVQAEAELLFYNPPPHLVASGGFLRIRGIGAAGIALRPKFRIIAGRIYQSGRQELVVGVGAQRGFGLAIGDHVATRNATWQVVGVYTAEGVITNELIGDVETLAAIEHRGGYGSVGARLEDPARLEAFKQWLTSNPTLAVTAETQLSYYARIAASQSEYFTAMAYLAGAILSLGALLGSVNILYGIVSARAREMATLRAIGYGAVPVAASVVFEALLLALVGAAAGTCIAWARSMAAKSWWMKTSTPYWSQRGSLHRVSHGRYCWHWWEAYRRRCAPAACRSFRRCGHSEKEPGRNGKLRRGPGSRALNAGSVAVKITADYPLIAQPSDDGG
jgi:putative ABC transport system permease protein